MYKLIIFYYVNIVRDGNKNIVRENGGVDILMDCLNNPNTEIVIQSLQTLYNICNESNIDYLFSKGYINIIQSFCIHINPLVSFASLQVLYTAFIDSPNRLYSVIDNTFFDNIATLIMIHHNDEKISTLLRKLIIFLNRDPLMRRLIYESKIIDTVHVIYSEMNNTSNCLFVSINRLF